MLALAMSFIMRPKVLLIDELSLGLAPVIVGQLLPIIQRMAKDGVTVVLVEQSVNVALTVAERAYFMERGEIRFSGPTAELLERPDLLRSVFLSAGDESNGADSSDARVERNVAATARRPTAIPAPERQRYVHDDAAVPVLSVNGMSVTFGGIRAVDNVTFEIGAGEIVGVIGPNGAGKTTMFDLISGFTPLQTGRIMLAGRDVTALELGRPGTRRARPLVPGRPTVPRTHGGRDPRHLPRTLRREPQRVRRRPPPPDAPRLRTAREQAGRRAARVHEPQRVPQLVRP